MTILRPVLRWLLLFPAALALAAEGAFDRVIGSDLSPDALAVARANLAAIPPEKRASVEFREGDLTAPLAGETVIADLALRDSSRTHRVG